MALYRTKPLVVEARQHGADADHLALLRWIEENTLGYFDPMTDDIPASGVSIDPDTGQMMIATPEGVMRVKVGDWVIRGLLGEFYPCKDAVFTAKYELAE